MPFVSKAVAQEESKKRIEDVIEHFSEIVNPYLLAGRRGDFSPELRPLCEHLEEADRKDLISVLKINLEEENLRWRVSIIGDGSTLKETWISIY